MDIDSFAYKHDYKKLNALLDEGVVPTAQTLCNLVLYESKSTKLQQSNLTAVQRIIAMGVNPNELPHDEHAPAVDLAAGSPNAGLLKFLLDSGASPDPASTVHCAIAEDLVDNLQVLAEYGVDLETPMLNSDPEDDYTPIPLAYAQDLKARKCLKLLKQLLA